MYHKEPGKSSFFVKKDIWKQVAQYNPNLLLVHARGASKGVGEPHYNQNNHPFTSHNKAIGLIHNGRVDEYEYQVLKQKYESQSQCDSEILLRIFEAGELYPPEELEIFEGSEYPQRLAGIRDIYSLVNLSHMAVAVGERLPAGDRLLWLFRNRHRPLWIVDLRDALGQVFFVSEPSIWEEAVRECSGVKHLVRSQKLIELPIEEVWHFKITSENICPDKVQRYEVCKEPELMPWIFDGEKVVPNCQPQTFEVITVLDDKDKVKSKMPVLTNWEEFPIQNIKTICEAIEAKANDVLYDAEQLIGEQSISKYDFDQLVVCLENVVKDLDEIQMSLRN